MSLVGKKVKHSKYGEGIVIDSRYNDFELLVEFANKRKFFVRIDELEFIDSEKNNPKPHITPSKENKNRLIIEALRLGIVPSVYIDEFTFGREKEIEEINKWLTDTNNSTKIILGEYGSGKTHFLNYIFQFALRNNFAVSMISIDPNETPFFKPKQIYKHLIIKFKYFDKTKNQICSFRDFLKEIFKKFDFSDNIYFRFLKNNLDNEEVLEWIEGKGYIRPQMFDNFYYYIYKDFPPMFDYSGTSNLYCYLLTTISWSTKLLGLNGFVIILDEVENKNLSHTFRQWEYTKIFLISLICISQNFDPKDVIFKFFTNPISTKIRDVPYIYRSTSYLKVIFGCSTLSDDDILLELSKTPLYLEPMNEEALVELYNAISTFYSESYSYNHLPNFKTFNALVQEQHSKSNVEFPNILKNHTRLFVKYVIEFFDLLRHKIISL